MWHLSLPASGLLLTLTSACASATPPPPAQHDVTPRNDAREAARHQGEALVHAAEYDPSADGTMVPCDGPKGQCWKPRQNPTAEHAREASAHRRAADAVREAAGWPRGAEETLCRGIPEALRSESPFRSTEIVEVEPLRETEPDFPRSKLVGVRLHLRVSMELEEFRRRIDCYVDHVMSQPGPDKDHTTDPLLVSNTHALVSETARGKAIELRAADETRAGELLRRAKAAIWAR